MKPCSDTDDFFLSLLNEGHLSVTPSGEVVGKHGRPIGSTHASGYIRIAQLDETGKRRHLFAHRLVYQALIGEIPEGLQINHRDGDKTNNHPYNLELATASENIQHAHDTGLASVHKGSKHINAKLSEEQIDDIRASYIPRVVTMQSLADRYGVSTTVIHRIVHSESYQ